ncbi:conserved hypothetical protein [Desulforapulum autotrophicum HRM2]|uniref:Pyridoxal phosphate homeostasis protein n=1 Tax=Desulforapulum autotrophicum (strain ATCC 43914 / DSM 3382 / VKM B-1955 / HRM2) TaxID=177437 RepID=C0QER6_DESAH|nr:YggS family pyridoxal phosphate-dependent enzyme [Desulforapulum autotrophicum]ACN15408.1 conserved hypothetical protein [Desulforapulum autotrophicum HRM2]
MNEITNRLKAIRNAIKDAAQSAGRNPDEILLVGVSKRQSAAKAMAAVHAGVTILGENYIQEAVEKIETLKDLEASWHFIGHLQTNKARFAVQHFDLIHTVDSIKLAREIDKQAQKIKKIQKILIQINISQESSKSGARADDALALVRGVSLLKNVAITGLMGMPPFFDDPEQARPFFRELAQIRSKIEDAKIPNVLMDHLSMGMSGDFKAAIEEGSTMVRIGTAIFGARS